MARIRTIKPAFFRSTTVADLPVTCRLTFIGLWTYVDDQGRGKDDTRLIKADVWPLDDSYTASKVAKDLDLLEKAGLISRYTVEDRSYLHICTWDEHQKINRPSESTFPPPPTTHEPSPHPHGGLTEDAVKAHGARTEDSRPEGNKEGNKEEEGKGTVVANDDAPSDPDVVEHLCNLLADLVEANGSNRPTITVKWRTECDRAMRIDGRTPDQLERAMRWAQADPFWRSNVMSMPKLRDQFDRLRLQANRNDNRLTVVPEQTNGKAAIAEYRRRKGLTA